MNSQRDWIEESGAHELELILEGDNAGAHREGETVISGRADVLVPVSDFRMALVDADLTGE